MKYALTLAAGLMLSACAIAELDPRGAVAIAAIEKKLPDIADGMVESAGQRLCVYMPINTVRRHFGRNMDTYNAFCGHFGYLPVDLDKMPAKKEPAE